MTDHADAPALPEASLEAERPFVIPPDLPVLPLRDVVLFPQSKRKQSIG